MRAAALRQGDAVALIAPAGPLREPDQALRACEVVRALGLDPHLGSFAADAELPYLAGSDERRADAFNQAVADPRIRGIFSLRGGYGVTRILERIDYEALARAPKIVLGYSDLTALLNAVTQRTGLLTFHGPVAALSSFSDFETTWLRAAIMRSEPLGVLHARDALTLVSGCAEGRLAGGNLSLLAALAGTPFDVALDGALMLIEETDETAYRIDRMLTQLRMSGSLRGVRGVIAGGFTSCGDVGATLRDRLCDLGVPVLAGVPAGHVEDQWTLPIGAHAILDADAHTVTIDEPAVIRAD